MGPTVDKQSLSLAEYLERIASIRSQGHERVRVRVTPYEQARLILSWQGHIPPAISDDACARHVFLVDTLGANEWLWDNTITEPVIEPIDG